MKRTPRTTSEEDLAVFDDAQLDEASWAVIVAEHGDDSVDGYEPVDPVLAERLPGEALPGENLGGESLGGESLRAAPGARVPAVAAWATYPGRLDMLLDDVSEDEAVLAMAAGRRARSVEAARVWALSSDEFLLPGADLSPAKRREWVMRVFVSEIATRLHVSTRVASRLTDDSHTLVRELPVTLDLLERAVISYRHAQVIIDHARTLPVTARAGFEEALTDAATRLPVARFRQVAARTRELLHPESLTERKRAAVKERRFTLEPAEDGMAWISHYLPAEQALALFDRITRLARSLQVDGESRTLPQLRSDVATDLLLDGRVPSTSTSTDTSTDAGRGDGKTNTSSGAGVGRAPRWGIRPTVIVTVPVATLLGDGDEPGNLNGYGPIDADTARRMAARAPSFYRLLTHPETGVALSLGKERYKLTKAMRLWLTLRDETCRGPGCNHPAGDCDIDHSEAAAFGGPTDVTNLAALCGPWHRMKHLTTWKVHNRGSGILDWTSPTGRTHTTHPATTLPHPPPARPAGAATATADDPPPF